MCAFIKTCSDINRVKLSDFRIKVGEGIYDEQTGKYKYYEYLTGKEIANYFKDTDESKYDSIMGMKVDLNRTKTVAVRNITIHTRTETEHQLILDTITYTLFTLET